MKDKIPFYKQLKTTHYDEAKADIPWNAYPRPQFVRNSFFCLNGEWDFEISGKDFPKEYNNKILVPFPPESDLSGIKRTPSKEEYLYYRRFFSLPDGFKKEKVILHFGAVDGICEVFLNQKQMKVNKCPYIPFSIDITEHLHEEKNEIEIRVKDDTSPTYPYGKQRKKRGGMWYTPISGIWQTVWLESVPQNHIKSLKITQNETQATIKVFGGCGIKKLTLTDSGEEFEFSGNEITVMPKNPKLWTPDTPYLYYFKLTTGDDEITSYFALRSIGICDTPLGVTLSLNKKPYLFSGLLDQGYFSDGIFLPPSHKGYENDILTAKKLGFNMLRKHIKIEPMIFYHLCDKLGMVVFQDAVNNGRYSFIKDTALPTIGFKKKSDVHMHRDAETREAFFECADRMIDLLYNSPSVLYYTIFNEGWGQFSADKAYSRFKAADGTRIIDSTSGWFWQSKSDVDSHHVYFRKIKADLVERPLVISEFGGYSYRIAGHCYGEKNYGYSKYDTTSDFENAITRLYEDEVIPLAKRGACAFVYTQLSDVEDETNGFITYDRHTVKVNIALMSKLNERLREEFTKATKNEDLQK